MNEISANNLWDIDYENLKEFLNQFVNPWEALPKIEEFIKSEIKKLSDEYKEIRPNVFVHETAQISEHAYFEGENIIIGPKVLVRPASYVRENSYIMEGTIVGNSVEIKNSILMKYIETSHYNYVGDAILGNHAHLGGGVILSNLKQDRTDVIVNISATERIETHIWKFSALLGDKVAIGANSVLNPGTIIGKNSRVYPLTATRHYIPSNHILKDTGELVERNSSKSAEVMQ